MTESVEQIIRQGLSRLFPMGGVVELRILDLKQGSRTTPVASGYYDDLDKLAREAAALDGMAMGFYVTLNQVNPALLARRKNKLATSGRMATTADQDITARSWIPLDIDPIRPADISSTDEEHAASLERAKRIREWLRDNGWPDPLLIDSGNGHQLLYRCYAPNDKAWADPTRILVENVLKTISLLFSDDQVKVDTSVANAARIWKLPGTMVCKGENTAERPHRRSAILDCPEKIEQVTEDQLKAIEKLGVQIDPPREWDSAKKMDQVKTAGVKAQDLLDRMGCRTVNERRGRLGTMAKLDVCPWNRSHTRSAWLLWDDDGNVLAAGCPHESCGRNDNKLRGLLDQYMPGWKTGKTTGKGEQPVKEPRGKAKTGTDDEDPEVQERLQHIEHRKREAKYRSRALEIMRTGDPIGFILNVYNRLHVGDTNHGKLLLATIGDQSVSNSDGTHPDTSGESGSGKSHSHKCMAHLVPPEYLVCASVSPKALFYADLKPSTVVYLDDMETIDPVLAGVIKRATSQYQKLTEHITVDDRRRKKKLYLPPRLVWWITSVDSDFDMQVLNRFLSLTVDDSIAHKRDIMRWQLERAGTGVPELPENEDVWTCREIIRILKEQLFDVVIPYWQRIEWNNPQNSRNLPMFLDTIRGFAAFRYMQRERDVNGSVIATIQDYNDAKQLWSTIKESQVSKLTKAELALLDALKRIGGEADVNRLQKELGKSRSTLLTTLNGRDGRSGLLSKVPLLKREDITEGESEDGRFKSTSRKLYSLPRDYNILENFQEIVHLKPDHQDNGECRRGDDAMLKQETPVLQPNVETVESKTIVHDEGSQQSWQPIANPETVQQRDIPPAEAEASCDTESTPARQAQQAPAVPQDVRMHGIFGIIKDLSKDSIRKGGPDGAPENEIVKYMMTYNDAPEYTRELLKKLVERGLLMRLANFPYYYQVVTA